MAITHEKYLEALAVVKQYRIQCAASVREIDEIYIDPNTLINKAGFSARAINILKSDFDLIPNEHSIKDIDKISFMDLLKARNCGIKTRMEIIQICEKAGVNLYK